MKLFDSFKDSLMDKVDGAKKLLALFNVLLFAYNIISFVVFTVTIFLTFKNSSNRFFQTLTFVTLMIYFAMLVVLIALNVFTKKSLNKQIKGYRKGMKIVKIILQFFNLLLSIFVIISASGGDFFSTMWQVVLIIFSSVGLFLNIAFFVIMHKWNKRRALKKASKPQKPHYEDARPVLTQPAPPSKQKLAKFNFKELAKNFMDSYFSDDNEKVD